MADGSDWTVDRVLNAIHAHSMLLREYDAIITKLRVLIHPVALQSLRNDAAYRIVVAYRPFEGERRETIEGNPIIPRREVPPDVGVVILPILSE